uniref:Uncharacterized protein n=1 Tax=Accipiter nisus TaxID=211598 RepID=A0A8B9MSR1_9AVES
MGRTGDQKCFSHSGQLSGLGGCGILGVGIWLAVTQGNFATLSSSFPSLSAANLLIVTGTFVMIIGFVGCIGAIKENKCLLSFLTMLLTCPWRVRPARREWLLVVCISLNSLEKRVMFVKTSFAVCP